MTDHQDTAQSETLTAVATSAGRVLNVSKRNPDDIFIEKFGQKWIDYRKRWSNIENFIAMRNAAKQQMPLVRVSFLLNEINAHEQEEFKQKWAEKADYVSFQRFVPISTHDDALSRAKKETPISGKQNCSYPWESLFVHGDGVVVPCAAHRGRFISVGNINENSLREIWHSDAMNELRKALKSGDLSSTKLCYTCLN